MKFFGPITANDLRKPSVIALILANLVPVGGVLFFGWEVFSLMFLFWSENVIVGVFNLLKMMVATPFKLGVLPMIPFFAVHFGLFTYVHGVFILAIFGDGMNLDEDIPDPTKFWQIMLNNHLGWAVLALMLSQGISFITNYLGQREFKREEPQWLMWQPYGRIIVLHVAIIGSGFILKAMHSPLLGLLLLVGLKTLLDLAAHLRERVKFSATAQLKTD